MPQDIRIAVITHAIDTFEDGGYLLHRLIELWKTHGVQAIVAKGADASPPGAEIAIAHLDMTIIGEEYEHLMANYPVVINGRVRDISKRVFSKQIITLEDSFRGPVIVKTDKNFGGLRELEDRHFKGDANATIEVQRPWRKVEFLTSYVAFKDAASVPLGVWRNPNLIVEKFRPEPTEDGEYVLRVWVFFGDRGIYYQCISDEPIIKSHNTKRRISLNVADIPPALKEVRESLGFDFGKFDFGIVDGQVVLYDVNRTPGSPASGKLSPESQSNIQNLSEGLNHFIERTRG